MRILTALVLAQCLGVAFLVYQGARAPAPPTALPPVSVAASAPAMPGAVPLAPVDEQRLRQIVREELATAGGIAAARAPGAGPAPLPPEELARRREEIEQKLAFYRSAGRISEAEMSDLQGRIAKLDPASRREMLGRLTRAINAREIEGQL